MSSLPRLVSGIQPTGTIHIGNYFGAIAQMVALQETHESFIFVVDLHAFNAVHDPKVLSQNILSIAAAYLACGLDPKKVTLAQQSQVSTHADLTWILNCITPMGLLERGHAYKDALAKEGTINMGKFDYPVLMAADILLYQAIKVPVGNDQQQHIEIASDIAGKFNHLFGETFVIPQAYRLPTTAVVPGIDGRKMSKSYNNVIGLFEEEVVLRKKVMSIITDSRTPEEPKDPDTCVVFALHKVLGGEYLPELEKRYRQGGISYKESKELLFEELNAFLTPLRERYNQLMANPEAIKAILKVGSEKALAESQKTLHEVRERIGMGNL